jgi:hypothetical protein
MFIWGQVHLIPVTSWHALVPTSIMNLFDLVLRLSESVSDMEVKLRTTSTSCDNWQVSVAVENASVYCSEQISLASVYSLIYFNVVLAHERRAASLDNRSYLLTVLVVNLSSRPLLRTPAETTWQELTNWGVSLDFVSISSMFGNNLRFVLSYLRTTDLLAETVFVFFNVSNLLTILPNNVLVGSI